MSGICKNVQQKSRKVREKMSDYIKREDAINASKLVYIECIEKDDGGFLEVDADYIPIVLKRDIMELPAADVVERKQGKWIRGRAWSEGFGMGESYGFWFKCSECGKEVQGGYPNCRDNFCWNCGAEMESADDV